MKELNSKWRGKLRRPPMTSQTLNNENSAIPCSGRLEMENRPASIPKLPNDVIVEILTWLPVKPLLKFRCVCKTWLSIISSPQFAKAHLRNAKRDSNFESHRIILNCRGILKQCSVESVLREPFIDAFETEYSVRTARDFLWVVGSCDGLVCLCINKQELVLWNPSTRIGKRLPDFGAKLIYGGYFAYGFGFDKSMDDYKVVGFFHSAKGLPEMMVKVYSLKRDQWRSIESYNGCWLMDDPATYAQGKLHWLSNSDLESRSGWDIVFLDLETEECGVMHVPDYVKSDYYSRLGASEGCLFVLCSHLISADVWIMDYKEGNGTWTKMVTIPYVDDLLRYTYKKALYILKNGEVLLLCGSKFVIFDSTDSSFRYPDVRNSYESITASTYIETLVSPVNTF